MYANDHKDVKENQCRLTLNFFLMNNWQCKHCTGSCSWVFTANSLKHMKCIDATCLLYIVFTVFISVMAGTLI